MAAASAEPSKTEVLFTSLRALQLQAQQAVLIARLTCSNVMDLDTCLMILNDTRCDVMEAIVHLEQSRDLREVERQTHIDRMIVANTQLSTAAYSDHLTKILNRKLKRYRAESPGLSDNDKHELSETRRDSNVFLEAERIEAAAKLDAMVIPRAPAFPRVERKEWKHGGPVAPEAAAAVIEIPDTPPRPHRPIPRRNNAIARRLNVSDGTPVQFRNGLPVGHPDEDGDDDEPAVHAAAVDLEEIPPTPIPETPPSVRSAK